MSDYYVKMESVKRALSDFLKKKTIEIYSIEQCYREFTADDLVFDMQKYYISKFEEEFPNLTQNMRLELGCYGRNIGYALKTFIKLNVNCTEKSLGKFANEFLLTQLDDDFEHWFDDLKRQDNKKTV
jgi:hypothetical protein